MEDVTVDRQHNTPFLVRLFYRSGGFHRLDDFTPRRQPHRDELQLYTWMDATLSELAALVSPALPAYLQPQKKQLQRGNGPTKLTFRLIYGAGAQARRYSTRDIGHVVLGTNASDARHKTLKESRFVIGDWIDVAVTVGDDEVRGARSAPAPLGASGGRQFRQGYGRGGRSPPYRARSPPYRGRSPPYRGRSPPYRGRSPSPYRGRSPPYRGRSPPVRRRSPSPRGRMPAYRGRSPSPRERIPGSYRGRGPSDSPPLRRYSPSPRGRSPPPYRGRSPDSPRRSWRSPSP